MTSNIGTEFGPAGISDEDAAAAGMQLRRLANKHDCRADSCPDPYAHVWDMAACVSVMQACGLLPYPATRTRDSSARSRDHRARQKAAS